MREIDALARGTQVKADILGRPGELEAREQKETSSFDVEESQMRNFNEQRVISNDENLKIRR